MSTVTEPATAVERASREHVAALILKAVRDHGLPYPRRVSYGEDIPSGPQVGFDIDGRAGFLGWLDYLGEPIYRSGLSAQIPWLGWTAMVSYREMPAELAAETAALIDEVTATCTSCDGEMVHQVWCSIGSAIAASAAVVAAEVQDDAYSARHAYCKHVWTVPALLACDEDEAHKLNLPTAPECPGCHVLNGSHQPHCYAVSLLGYDPAEADDPETVAHELLVAETSREFAAEMEASRVDVEAAAQIPVVVVEVAAEIVHLVTRSGKNACGDPDFEQYATAYARLVTCVPCGTIVSPKRIDLTSVGRYFAATWAGLNALQRARLVEACQIAGWFGDWTACYRQATVVRSDQQVATAVDELMADEGSVDHDQLAEALTTDPDEEIAYEIAHRHEPVPVVDVVTVDPELDDDGRGGAGVERMTGVVINLTRGTVEGLAGGES